MSEKLLMTIQVKCHESLRVQGQTMDIVMIPFSGTAEGADFRGEIAPGAVDTQKIPKGGTAFLSARYLLKGTDRLGNPCQVFVENLGTFSSGFKPFIVTDSPALAVWETAELSATVQPAEGGVCVRIFMQS